MSERINVHVPILSANSRSVIGDAREDRRTVTSQRTGHGGHIHPGDRRRDQTPNRTPQDTSGPTGGGPGPASRASIRSIASVGSISSIGSAGSVLSIGSAGSVLSIGSAGSVLSIGSAGSVLSIGSAGSVLSIGGHRSSATGRGRDDLAGRLVEPAATVLAVSALAAALIALRR